MRAARAIRVCDSRLRRREAATEHDYVPVLTRSFSGVFVVGGNDVDSGLPTGEIWFTAVDDPVWSEVATGGYQPEHVLAATYSFLTQELYVLDETSTGRARLVGISLRTHTTRTLIDVKRHPVWNTHFLVVDRDGELLVASSRDGGGDDAENDLGTSGKHRITRVIVSDPTGQSDVGIHGGNREVVLPPVVDATGTTLVLRRDPIAGTVVRERWRSLSFKSKKPHHLGKQL